MFKDREKLKRHIARIIKVRDSDVHLSGMHFWTTPEEIAEKILVKIENVKDKELPLPGGQVRCL